MPFWKRPRLKVCGLTFLLGLFSDIAYSRSEQDPGFQDPTPSFTYRDQEEEIDGLVDSGCLMFGNHPAHW